MRNERRLKPLLYIVCSFSTGEDPFNSVTEYYETREGDQTTDPAWRRRTGRTAAGVRRGLVFGRRDCSLSPARPLFPVALEQLVSGCRTDPKRRQSWRTFAPSAAANTTNSRF